MEEKLKSIFIKEYSENKLTNFVIKTQKIYDYLGYDFVLKQPNIGSNKCCGSMLWLNEKYVNSSFSDLDIITFNMVYPKLITKMVETNLQNFNEVFSKLIEIYYLYKDIELKNYINMVYGFLQNPECEIYSSNIYQLPIILNNILNNILLEFKEHIVYINFDKIIFRNFDEIRSVFNNYFDMNNKYEISYFTEKSKFGLFISQHRYIIEEHGNIKIKNIKLYNENGMRKGGLVSIK